MKGRLGGAYKRLIRRDKRLIRRDKRLRAIRGLHLPGPSPHGNVASGCAMLGFDDLLPQELLHRPTGGWTRKVR